MNGADSIIHSLDTIHAPLPVVYESAKTALHNCVNVDECINWADKALALASYARQSHDDELEKLAIKIRSQAIRRCGELLKMFDGKGNNQHSRNGSTKQTQREAAKNAGLSKDQQVQAVRMANIPEPEFEAHVEAEKPLSPSQLAELGRREYLSKPKPPGFADAIHFKGALELLAEKTDEFDPAYLIGGMDDEGKEECRKLIGKIEKWFDRFMVRIG
jgi:hypothetical protein